MNKTEKEMHEVQAELLERYGLKVAEKTINNYVRKKLLPRPRRGKPLDAKPGENRTVNLFQHDTAEKVAAIYRAVSENRRLDVAKKEIQRMAWGASAHQLFDILWPSLPEQAQTKWARRAIDGALFADFIEFLEFANDAPRGTPEFRKFLAVLLNMLIYELKSGAGSANEYLGGIAAVLLVGLVDKGFVETGLQGGLAALESTPDTTGGQSSSLFGLVENQTQYGPGFVSKELPDRKKDRKKRRRRL